MNLEELSDKELDLHRVNVLREVERRENIKRIPTQIEELTEKYLSEGGDPDLLETTDLV